MLLGIGNSNSTAIFIVFVGVYFLLTLSTVAAVGSVDPRLIETARTYGASEQQVWQWVIFPAVLPQVFITLRINFFAAWMAVLATEMVGLKNGVGMMVILGREMFNGNLIMLGICIVGIVGYAVDSFLLFVQRKVLWWKQRGRDEFTPVPMSARPGRRMTALPSRRCATSRCRCPPASSSPCSARPAAARARCSNCSPGWRQSTPARCVSTTARLPGRTRMR